MNSSTHIDLTRLVAEEVGWPGDIKRLARCAYVPDEMECIKVGDLGTHFLGFDFSAWTHFCRPTGDGRYKGYNHEYDKRLFGIFPPGVDLTVKSLSHKWVMALGSEVGTGEPLSNVISTLEGHGSLDADELTFPTAAVMAGWLELGFTSKANVSTLDDLSGYICHFVQDCCVPHHAAGTIFHGHREFEGAVESNWWRMNKQEARHEARLWKVGGQRSVRALCEEASERSNTEWVSSGSSHMLSPWACIQRGIEYTAITLNLLKLKYGNLFSL
jgi:hypothetical protein